MKEAEAVEVADLITRVLRGRHDSEKVEATRRDVAALAESHQPYPPGFPGHAGQFSNP